ncbi:ArsA family ATPase [Streptomyces sp. NBC_01795]|uniref:ArsA family ATPase n=1 Tax=Streptomyces sp. NBC_01795 TaxID=2975943 RepID=UPI002DD86A0A|nr:ArsA-related P-loop ATPase [Streptomyces sp. NBC_01795]WSA97386.1 ArsA family ATPase [Streptomyces sp. NBC_01795]
MVTGAGGAGRTTVAAATACAAAGQGHRTLLLSAESAPRLAALLGAEGEGSTSTGVPNAAPGSGAPDAASRSAAPDAASSAGAPDAASSHRRAPEQVAAVPGLWLLRIDSGEEFRAQAVELQQRGKAALDLLGAAPLDEDELTELPGAGTFALLRALRTAHATAGPDGGAGDAERPEGSVGESAWDIVVVDMPPTPDGLNLLALPEQLRRYLRRLVPHERQAARALRPVLAQLAGVPMPEQWLYDASTRWSAELAEVQRAVESPATVVRLVTEPGPLAAGALRTAGAGLRLHGLELESVVANRLLPVGSADAWLAGLAGQQQAALKELREKCEAESIPLCELPHLGRDPRGPEDLVALANAARTAVTGAAGPGARSGARATAPTDAAPAAPVPQPREGGPGTDVAHGWVEDRLTEDGKLVWHLPLPGATREELELVRRGDELTVGVGPYRRVLALPSALRRCRVSGAALNGGALRVRFTPDPGLWPGSGDGGQ